MRQRSAMPWAWTGRSSTRRMRSLPTRSPRLTSGSRSRLRICATICSCASLGLRSRRRSFFSGLGGDVLLGFVPPWWIDAALRGRPVWVARALLERTRLYHERPRLGVRAILAALRSRPAPIAPPGWVARRAGGAPVPRRRELTPPRLARFDLRDFVTDPTWPTVATLAHSTTTSMPLRFVHPFYDLRLVSLAARLSPELWLRSKKILRETTRDRLPERVRTRPKTPLVRAVAPGDTRAASSGLRELVLLAPDLDRFVERELLAEAASVPGQSHDFARDAFLCRGLGLAHWLTHRRPRDDWQQP